MDNKSNIIEQIEVLKKELNTAVSHNNNLNDRQLIELSIKIDDLAISLCRKAS